MRTAPTFVQASHEENAALMAIGEATKYGGGCGVIISTQGPGVVHLLNGLYDARSTGFPWLPSSGSSTEACWLRLHAGGRPRAHERWFRVDQAVPVREIALEDLGHGHGGRLDSVLTSTNMPAGGAVYGSGSLRALIAGG